MTSHCLCSTSSPHVPAYSGPPGRELRGAGPAALCLPREVGGDGRNAAAQYKLYQGKKLGVLPTVRRDVSFLLIASFILHYFHFNYFRLETWRCTHAHAVSVAPDTDTGKAQWKSPEDVTPARIAPLVHKPCHLYPQPSHWTMCIPCCGLTWGLRDSIRRYTVKCHGPYK